MKIIDLLNKIANGEEVPKKIKYQNCEYEFNPVDKEYQRWFYGFSYGLGEDRRLDIILNDEVEVCSTGLTVKEAEENLYKFSEALYKEANKKREKKIPEKIKLYAPYPECEDTRFEDVEDKINEIIDFLKSKGDE